MKVSSPVGDFPFELRGITLGRRGITLEGAMGAWPSRIELEPRDLMQPALVRALMPLGLALVIVVSARSAVRRITN